MAISPPQHDAVIVYCHVSLWINLWCVLGFLPDNTPRLLILLSCLVKFSYLKLASIYLNIYILGDLFAGCTVRNLVWSRAQAVLDR